MATITNEQLLKLIKKTGDISQYDVSVKNVVIESSRRLVDATPKDTGILSKPWGVWKKIGKAKYAISNNITTQGKKWNLASLFNDGTRTMTKTDGFFYIPLNNKGKGKKLGAKISKDLKFGVDYVLTKTRKGIKATHFIDKEEKRAKSELEKAVSKRVDELIK